MSAQSGVTYTVNSIHYVWLNTIDNTDGDTMGSLCSDWVFCYSDPEGFPVIESSSNLQAYASKTASITKELTGSGSPLYISPDVLGDEGVKYILLAKSSAVYGGTSIVANMNGGQDQKTSVADYQQTAHFPLGADFTLALLDSSENVIPSKYSFSSDLPEDVPESALFPSNVAFQYSSDISDRGSFHAAHLGSATLTITPTGSQSGISPVTVTVKVVNPASLGSEHNEVDSLIYPIANQTGIPPNFIKAQVAQESGDQFNPLAYRYEPLSIDAWAISRGQDQRANDFAMYRFATIKDSEDTELSQGAYVDSDDLAIRDKFPCCGSAPTAYQIVSRYDGGMNWCKIRGYLPDEEQDCLYLLSGDDFTEQTSLASSYGYMQITYLTANQVMNWAE